MIGIPRPALSRGLVALVAIVLLGSACSHSTSERRLDGRETAVDREPTTLRLSSSAAGISVAYPRGWQATGEPLTSVTWPPQRLAIASYPLEQASPDPGCAPATAFAAMPADGAFIYLMEYTAAPDAVGLIPGFAPRPAHFGLDERTFAAYECLGESYLIRFADHGRRFQVHVAFGASADARTRATALAILDSLVIASSPDAGEMVMPGASGCRPSSPASALGGDRRAPELRATTNKGEVWVLLFLPRDARWESLQRAIVSGAVGKPVKIVWRVTGSGGLRLTAFSPDGDRVEPSSGPTKHESSTWERPGTEWGTVFRFREPGCWRLHAERGSTKTDIWLFVHGWGRAERSTNWKALRRPLHLPTVAPGEACPRTPTERDAPNVAFTIGKGPVFPVLGFSEPAPAPGAVARLRDDIRRDGYYLHKTLWAISARYHGPVLIRGRRIDGPGALRFSGSRHELRVPAGPGKPDRPGRGWRYGPTATLIPRAGCYAFQIDGRGFSRVLVFEARR